MRKVITNIVLVFAIAAAAGGGVFAWQSERVKNDKAVLEGDNASLRLQLRQIEEQAAAKTPPPPPPAEPPPSAVVSDKDQVIALIKAACAAQAGADITKGTFTLVRNNETFAKVDYNCSSAPANARAIFKKAAGTWALVYSASPAPSRTIIQRYGIPEEFR